MKPLLRFSTLVALTGCVGLAGPAAAQPVVTALTAPAARVDLVEVDLVEVDVVEVDLDGSRHDAVVGNRFAVRSRVSNPGPTATERFIAHLNVASLTSDVYVDPEDWSSMRTQEVPELAPGASATLSWDLQAVNAGSFAVYVVVLPNGGSPGTGPLAVSSPVHVLVAGRRTLNAGGSLPIVLLVPVLLGAAAVIARSRLRRSG